MMARDHDSDLPFERAEVALAAVEEVFQGTGSVFT
jgi:hypothetical protein